ncbi:MAG: VOC family protein [Gemmatimonadaceae bacterium]
MSSHGQFIWYDLITPDLDGSKSFYSHVIGWGTQESKGPQPYTMWENEGVPIGGLWPAAKGMGEAPQWLPYVSVDDVDATASKAKELGGQVSAGPDDIPGGGRYAILEDPQGAKFAIYRSGHSPQTPEFNPGCGQISWHELATTDQKKAFEFYSELFGWNRIRQIDMGPSGIYQVYGKGETMYGGMYDPTPQMPMATAWCCYIMVENIPDALDRVSESGGQVLNGPMEPPGTNAVVAQCTDPQGTLFGLHATKTAP